jgi:hypothetical protein
MIPILCLCCCQKHIRNKVILDLFLPRVRDKVVHVCIKKPTIWNLFNRDLDKAKPKVVYCLLALKIVGFLLVCEHLGKNSLVL